MYKLHSLIFGLFAFALFGLGVMGFSGVNYAADPVTAITQVYGSQELVTYSVDSTSSTMILTVYDRSGDMSPGLLVVSDAIPAFENVRSDAGCLGKGIAINALNVSNPHNARDCLPMVCISS